MTRRYPGFRSHPAARRGTQAALVMAAVLLSPAGARLVPAAPPPASRVLVVARTLVMDALGTRTVDTDRARIPPGSRGLLIKKVPYAGPPLSFRLSVLAGEPQEAGIPLTLATEVWSGEPAGPGSGEQAARREEATVLSAEGSYLLELDHDPRSGRRIVLSLTARLEGPQDEEIPFPLTPAGPAVRFLLEVIREEAGRADPPDQRVLSSFAGQAITYSSEVRLPSRPGAPAGTAERTAGLSVILEAEQVQGELVSVRVDLSGAEFTDTGRTRLEPFHQEAIHTVPSGTSFDVSVSIPSAPPGASAPAGVADSLPVRYLVRVTPFLEP
jgi:hypothetical protein